MLKIQQKLLNKEITLQELPDTYGIDVRRHSQFNNLVMLKYNQINADMTSPIVRECRGLILDESDCWKVVSFPFTKFFNADEPNAAKIDWTSAVVQEKLDGSIMSMYWYKGEWRVASNGSPDAGGNVHGFEITFAELFWETYKSMGYELPMISQNGFTFIFELTSPYNRIVVPYRKAQLTLIGIRNNLTQKEEPVRSLYYPNYRKVKTFGLGSLDEIINTFANFSGIDSEGYVVVDDQFNRIKIKHPNYVSLHHLKGNEGPTPKKILGIVLTGEGAEVLSYFPEWKVLFEEATTSFQNLVKDLTKDYTSIKVDHIADQKEAQKEFAKQAKLSKCPDALFKLRAGKVESIKQYLLDSGAEVVLDLLEDANA